MNKKIYKSIVLTVMLICAFGLAFVMNRTETTGTIVSENHFNDLKFCFEKNAGLQEIGCYYFDDIYYVFLPSFVEPHEVLVECLGVEKIVFSLGQDVIELENREKSEAFMTDTVYNVSLLDMSGSRLQSGRIKFMKSGNLPAMFVETESGSMDYLNENKNNREEGSMTLYSSLGSLECADELKHISGRGNQTWDFDKKSYAINLKNKADLLGMGAAKDWVLLCNVYDRSYIRNKITYEMAIASGIGWAPQSEYIDLYVNGQYHGLYQLCEKVEVDNQRVDIKNLKDANELANPEVNLSELQRYENEDTIGYLWEHEPKDITGGYLIERDYGYKYEEALSGFVSKSLKDHYAIESPDRASRAEMLYISTLFNEMEEAVIAEDGMNNAGKSYLDYIDVRSFANKYIIEEVTRNDGGGATSAFYYKPEDSKSKLIFAGPVWDYDKAYGRVQGIESNTYDLCFSTLHFDETLLYYYLYKQDEFQKEVKEIYREFYSNYLEILAEGDLIASYCEEIEPAARMDNIRWNGIIKNASYRDEAERIRCFIAERKEFLDAVWIEENPICIVKFTDEENAENTYLGVIQNEKLQSVPIRTDSAKKIFVGWFDEESKKEFDINTAITEDASVIAVWNAID